jgi:serine/threonine protein kinase
VVLAELLLQRRYFVGDDPTVVIENVLRADTTTLERVGDRLPPELELILRVALDPLPEQRFQSAQELETALVDFVRHCDWQLPTAHSVSSWLRVNRLIPSRSGVHPIELPRSETRERPRIIEEHERAHRRHG